MELKKFEKIVTSQWGEDGVIEEIFNRIGTTSKLCCEFGAWDGKHLSNCYDLWHNKGWGAVLIEGVEERCNALKEDLKDFDNVKAVNAFVELSGDNLLDNILEREIGDKRLDLLSIDIDSDDYAVFDSLTRKPRVIVIEYNPTIPPHIDLIQKAGEHLGNSISSTFKLAKKKGYSLAHITYTNLFLVVNEEFDKLGFEEIDYLRNFPYDKLTCVINTYDGDTILSQPMPYSKYIEPSDPGMRNYVKKRLKKEEPNRPGFETNGDLVHIKVVAK